MEDQQKAEQKKEASKDVREKLALQKQEISTRVAQVKKDLDEVEPAVKDAENGRFCVAVTCIVTRDICCCHVLLGVFVTCIIIL